MATYLGRLILNDFHLVGQEMIPMVEQDNDLNFLLRIAPWSRDWFLKKKGRPCRRPSRYFLLRSSAF